MNICTPCCVPELVVTFYDWDGTLLKEEIIDTPGKDATQPPDPERLNYKFKGWKGNYKNVTESRRIIATYDSTVTVTYVFNNGNA